MIHYKRQIICGNCYKEFFTSRPHVKFCPDCKVMRKLAKKHTVKICLECHKPYNSSKIKQKYCSEECSRKVSKRASSEFYDQTKKMSAFKIFERDNFTCVYCGKSSITDNAKLVIDHIYPVSEGGDGKLFNLVTSCEKCNSQKFNSLMDKSLILKIWEEITCRNEKLNIETYEELEKFYYENLLKRKRNLICRIK